MNVMQMLVCRELGDPRDEDESAIRRAELEAANASSTAGNAETAKRARTRLDRLREHRYLYPHGRMSLKGCWMCSLNQSISRSPHSRHPRGRRKERLLIPPSSLLASITQT